MGVRLYIRLKVFVTNFAKRKTLRVLLEYGVFVLFILIEIPFSIFFPAWISEKLAVIERTPNTTASLIVFGCVVLAFSVWLGNRAEARRFLMD